MSKPKRRVKASVRKTAGALFLATSIVVAAIPTGSLQGGKAEAANSCTGVIDREYYIVQKEPGATDTDKTPLSEIPYVDPATTVYTTGDMKFQFAYVNSSGVDVQGDTNKFAVILGYDPSGAVDSAGNLSIPAYVKSYKKLSDAEGYCLANVSGEFLYYRFVDPFDFSIRVKDGDSNPIESGEGLNYFNKDNVGSQSLYDFLLPYVPQEKRNNPGYYSLVKPNKIGLFRVGDPSGEREKDENGLETGYTIFKYTVENTKYYPCTDDNKSKWESVEKSNLFYRDEAEPDTSIDRYKQCDRAEHQYVDDIAVRYIGNQFAYYDVAEKKYKISTDKIDDIHPSNGVFADTKGGNIVNLTIPSTMEGIGDYAFYRCTSIKHVDFSNNLVAIGNHSFDGCRTLKSVGMPEDVRMNTIGEYAFKNCSALESFYIPHRIVMLCDGVFENCTSLTNMDLSGDISDDPTTEASQLEKIGNHLFYGCSNLQTLVLPYNLGQGYSSSDTGCRKININIVEDCPNLIRITVVSPNVAFVDDNHAGKCDFLVGDAAHSDKGSFHSQLVSDEFYFESVDPVGAQPPSTNIGALHQMCQNMDTGYEFTYKYYGEELYEKTVTEEGGGKVVYQVDDTNSLVGYLPTGMVKSLTFPEHFGPYYIEKIPDEKCMDTCTLEKVTLPSTINEIGARAFKGCHNLSMVFFGNDKVVIGDEAFKTQHTSLHSANCPDSLHNADCPDTKGGEPDVKLYFVTSVSADSTPFTYAMSNRGIYNHPQQLDSWPIVFSGFPDLLEISYNPEKKCAELINFPTEGSLNTYASAANKYLNDEEKDAISHYLAERSDPDHPKSREEIKISGTTYDKQLAEVCDELYIPKGVCSIKDGLFWKNTEDLGNNPIAVNTTGLTEFDVVYLNDSGNPTLDADGMVQVDPEKSDFAGCKNLTALTLSGDTTLTIPDYAFYDCDGMEYVWSSQSVDDIGKEAFAECRNLQSIEMYGVKSIGDHAFSNDDKLSDVKFDSSLSSLGVAPFRVNMYNRGTQDTYPTHTSGLTNVDFQDNSYFKTDNGIIYSLDTSGNKQGLIEFLPGRSAGTLQPGETKGVSGISKEAFADTRVNVVNLENATFYTLAEKAFEDTDGLVSVTLPQSCDVIDNYAFKGSNIKNLTVMSDELDWKSNGLDLIKATMTNSNDDSTDHGVSENANKNLTVYAPAEKDDSGNVTTKSKAYERFENHLYLVQAYTPIKHYYVTYYDYVDENATKATLMYTDEYVEGDQVILRDPNMDSDNKHSTAGFAFEYYYNLYDTEDTYDYRYSFNISEDLTIVAKYKGLNESYTAVFYDTDPDTGATGTVLMDNVPVLTQDDNGTTKYYINPNQIAYLAPAAKTGYTFQTWQKIDPRDGVLFTLDQVEEKDGVIKFYAKYSSGSGGEGGQGGGGLDPSSPVTEGCYRASYYYPNGRDLYTFTDIPQGDYAIPIAIPSGYSGYEWSPKPLETVMDKNRKFVLVPSEGTNPDASDKYDVTYYYTDGVTVYQTLSLEAGSTPPNLVMPAGYKQYKWSPDPSSATVDKKMRFTMVANPDYTGTDDGYTGPYYTLTVVNGSGSGSYKPGAQVVISANDAKTGTVFSSWTVSPDSTPIASKAMSATVITMPSNPVTVTANYVASTSNKNGNGTGGTGSGTNNNNNNKTPTGGNVVRSSGTTVVIDKNGLSNTGVVSATVNGSSDNFTIKVTASQTADKAVLDALLKKYGSVDNLVYFPMDISLYDAAGTTQIHDTSGLTITITLPLPDSMVQYGANNQVGYVVNGELDGLNPKFTTINGVPCVTFTCTHFSPYVIYVNTVSMAAGSDNNPNAIDNTPKTADPIHPKWFVSIALFAISIVLFLMKDKKTVKAAAGSGSSVRKQR